MADNLNIAIKLTGDKDIDKLIKQLNETGLSVNETVTLTKALKSAFDNLQPSQAKQREELGKVIAKLRDYKAEATAITQSTHAKMMTSYFTLGER